MTSYTMVHVQEIFVISTLLIFSTFITALGPFLSFPNSPRLTLARPRYISAISCLPFLFFVARGAFFTTCMLPLCFKIVLAIHCPAVGLIIPHAYFRYRSIQCANVSRLSQCHNVTKKHGLPTNNLFNVTIIKSRAKRPFRRHLAVWIYCQGSQVLKSVKVESSFLLLVSQASHLSSFRFDSWLSGCLTGLKRAVTLHPDRNSISVLTKSLFLCLSQ